MTSSFTQSYSQTFTVTHAKHLASKVAADLKRIQRFYQNGPTDLQIEKFEQELVLLLKHGYLESVKYGFQRNGQWIEPSLFYTASEISSGSIDDDPGKVRPNRDTSGAVFRSFLTYTSKWHALSTQQQDDFDNQSPIRRVGAPVPTINGYLESDRNYSSGGCSLNRSSVRTC
ncbi:hypothetical protein [Arsukibacterium indicum]|uniref:Bacterial HORMA domain-containing protein n=1 Tax=Arsukibacterium indicum TaxID=2848612 RepID=A0ABS6MJK2_9GAMM|nr:hypothetical protein [Arsukibacterium indicum]MBV2128935.1 hypothetical protein [Arsukibacterium indicum]